MFHVKQLHKAALAGLALLVLGGCAVLGQYFDQSPQARLAAECTTYGNALDGAEPFQHLISEGARDVIEVAHFVVVDYCLEGAQSSITGAPFNYAVALSAISSAIIRLQTVAAVGGGG